MNPNVLEVSTITKHFEKVNAVDQLSFHIQKGEIFALLGPNGAGKTTTVRMLLSIIRPDSGSIRYCMDGIHIGAPSSSELGYLPEDRGLYKEIPIERTLIYMGVLRGMRRDDAARASAQWLERVGLKDRARSTHKVLLTLEGTVDIPLFNDVPAVLNVERQTDGTLAFHLRKGESINRFLTALSARASITAIHSEQVSLHEVFVQSVKADAEQSTAENVK